MNAIDILSIHDRIVKDYNKIDETILNESDFSLNQSKWETLYSEISENTSNDVLSDIKKKFKTVDTQSTQNFNFYIMQTISLLEEYEKIKKSLQKVQFFRQNNSIEDDKKERLQTIIDQYMNIIKEFFPNYYNMYQNINCESEKITKKKGSTVQNNIKCTNCNLEQDQFVYTDNHLVCSLCGNVISLTNDNLISFRDIERVNIGSKYIYDRKTHFRECIKRFQGKQNVNIPSHIWENLYEKLLSYQLIPKNYKDLDKKEAFKLVTKEHIHMFLKELGCSKYYEDIVYIYHKITGHEIPDITHLENNLMADFDLLLETYDSVPLNKLLLLPPWSNSKTERKNFINNQYVLYQLLRKYKYSCKKEDFQFLKTSDRKLFHDIVCQQLFEKLGWNFHALY